MSAVLESLPASPVAAARAALEAAQGELAQLDARIRRYQVEQEEIETQRMQHRAAVITAVGAGKPLPKPLKAKQTDAETVLPILTAKRKEITQRVDDAQVKVRRACVQEVERRYQVAQDAFAGAATALIAAWADLVGMQALLEHAGVKAHPLPPALMSDFSIPALGRLRPICENHWAYFLAEHALAQGAGRSATWAARREIESELGMTLPW